MKDVYACTRHGCANKAATIGGICRNHSTACYEPGCMADREEFSYFCAAHHKCTKAACGKGSTGATRLCDSHLHALIKDAHRASE